MSEEIKHQDDPVAWQVRDYLTTVAARQNVELAIERDLYKCEVERLQSEVNRLMTKANAACGKELVALRAQMAERDALLRKALADIEYIQKECSGDVSPGYIGCLVDDVVNLLSASAEPKG